MAYIVHRLLPVLFEWSLIVSSLGIAVLCLGFLRRRASGVNALVAAMAGENAGNSIRADARQPMRGGGVAWFLAGALLLAGAFITLEIRQPFYFTQDDALMAQLPGTIEGCRSLWAGIWPDYDPYRLMGGPLAGEGLFSLTYPPTYISYAIARHVLGNEYATFEVNAALHLLLGYLFTWWMCRRAGMRPMIACCATLSFLLSGSILIMARSWPQFMSIVVWMPILVTAVIRLEAEDVGWAWALGTGLAGGLLFHAGFPQLWVYAVLLIVFAVCWLWMAGRIGMRRILCAICAGLISLGVAMPLLIPQLIASRDVIRPPVYGVGLWREWIAALLPYPLVKVAHPMGWGSTDTQYMGHFMYFGTVFAVLFIVGVGVILSGRPLRRTLAANVWIAAAVLALLLTMGRRGLVFFVLSKLPLVGMVNNNPFRALPFFVLFAVVGGGIVAERALLAAPRPRRWGVPLAILTLALLGYHVWMARPSFYTYGFKPYPPVAANIAKRIEGKLNGRLVSWSPVRSISPKLAAALPHNLPVLYGIPAFSGYDPLLEWGNSYQTATKLMKDDPLAAARAYGLRWHLLSTLLTDPVLSPNIAQNTMERHVKNDATLQAIKPLTVIAKTDDVRLAELTGVSPLAFPASKPTQSLPVSCDCSGITVPLTRLRSGGEIVVNFLWYSQLRATADGKPLAISHDRWMRITADVPAGTKSLKITYAAGWEKGLLVGGALVPVGLVASILLGRWRKLAV